MKRIYIKPQLKILGSITAFTKAKNHAGCDAPGGTRRQNSNSGFPPGSVSNCG